MFLFLVALNNVFIIPVLKEKIKVTIAIAIPAGVPITVPKEIIDTPPLVTERTIKTLSMQPNQLHIYSNFLQFNFRFLISWLR